MKSIGESQHRHCLTVVLIALTLMAPAAQAAVTAVVDRSEVALGDSFRLIITATDKDEELSDIDLLPLERDFEILQRSTSSQTSIINGRREHTKQLQIDLAAKRQGSLIIPPLSVSDTRTDPIPIVVGAPADMDSGGQPVVFEAEVDRTEVYVQGQVLVTLRIMQSINLDGRSLVPLELDNAFVRPLEQNSYQRQIDGRPWLVHEVRYAVFPEESGILTIPAQVFTARQAVTRRSFFDIGGGRRLRRTTEPVVIDVLPRPRVFPSDTWLPATSLRIDETWSTPPDQLRAGESATRSIRISADGLQGAQLPPVLFTPTEGMKFYPDQPQIEETETVSGLRSTRTDSAALVPVQAGTVELPEIRIPWWDTASERVRFAILPARTLNVAPATNTQPTSVTQVSEVGAPMIARDTDNPANFWRVWSGLATLAWLITLGILLFQLWQRGRRDSDSPTRSSTASRHRNSERRCRRRLLAACQANEAAAARSALIDWSNVIGKARGHGGSQARITSLHSAAALLDDAALAREINHLESALYATNAKDAKDGSEWRGDALAQHVQDYSGRRNPTAAAETSLSLYPS